MEDTAGNLIAGLALILVPAARTAALAPGTYRDELTVVIGDRSETQWRGQIVVLAKLRGK